MKLISIIVVCILISYQGKTQNKETEAIGRKVRFTAFASAGRSTFVSRPSAPSKFPTLELRLGGGIIKPIGKNIELRSRLTFGVKLKREAFNKPGQVYLIGPPFLGLDELASNRNYYFLEIPLVFQFNLPHPKLGFGFGVNYRHFLPHNKLVDSFANRREVGSILGITYRLTDKLHIGLDYYFGWTRIYSSAGLIDNQNVTMDARNQFAQVRFEFAVGKKN